MNDDYQMNGDNDDMSDGGDDNDNDHCVMIILM